MGRPAPIPRRSSHLGSAACYGRSAHGSHSSTSAASSRSKRRQGNHNRFQTLKMFPDGHLDVVLASSCVPQLHHAVSINGEPHWDGGFVANPPLIELIGTSRVPDVLLVQIIPMNGADLPRTKKEIEHRLNQITFNSPLKGELEAISTIRKLSGARGDMLPPLCPARSNGCGSISLRPRTTCPAWARLAS